tara:strand:- start:3460 stop:3798 length:339 start_codon:yes stop_codon:yes gene_type:complete
MPPDAESFCRSLLAVVDAIPSSVAWHVVATDYTGWLFIADSRPDASTLEMGAIAGEFGEIIAEQCVHSGRPGGKPIIGAIVELPAGTDQTEASERLRAAYAIATDGGGDQVF